MKTLDNFKLLGISIFLALGLAACDKKPGPAESAGKQMDQAATDAGKKIGQTADKVGEKIGTQTDKAAVVLDDSEITAKVKAAIFNEPGLKTLQISVETVKGVVTLSGSVDSMGNSQNAKSLAGSVAGVSAVQNKLVVKPLN